MERGGRADREVAGKVEVGLAGRVGGMMVGRGVEMRAALVARRLLRVVMVVVEERVKGVGARVEAVMGEAGRETAGWGAAATAAMAAGLAPCWMTPERSAVRQLYTKVCGVQWGAGIRHWCMMHR